MSTTIATSARPLEGKPAAGSKRRNRRRTGATKSASRAISNTSNVGPNSKSTDGVASNGGANATIASQKPVQGAEQKVDTAQSPTGGGSVDICWICAEPVKYYAVSECNHRTCHVCALRLRALYKKMDCTFCKVRTFFPLCWSWPGTKFGFRKSKINLYLQHLRIPDLNPSTWKILPAKMPSYRSTLNRKK